MTTEDHPFWNETEGRWQTAEKLDAGDAIGVASGQVARVRGIGIRQRLSTAAYNLTIAGVHTYHVGTLGLLVHNTCKVPKPAKPFLTDDYYRRKRTGRAPGQYAPYGRYERYDDQGNLIQVTTYNKYGRRAYQYDVGPRTRHGEGSHRFEYDEFHPPRDPGGGRRLRHEPFE